MSLVKGPVGILGAAGIVYGVLALIFGGNSFALRIPHGHVGDGHFIGLFTNGWTDLLFIAAGLLLLLSSRGHWSAKASSTLVALVLGAAAIVGVIRGDGVFGIFAANGLTEIIWGAAAIVLIVLARLPRVGGGKDQNIMRTGRDASAGTGASTSVGDAPADDTGLVSSR